MKAGSGDEGSEVIPLQISTGPRQDRHAGRHTGGRRQAGRRPCVCVCEDCIGTSTQQEEQRKQDRNNISLTSVMKAGSGDDEGCDVVPLQISTRPRQDRDTGRHAGGRREADDHGGHCPIYISAPPNGGVGGGIGGVFSSVFRFLGGSCGSWLDERRFAGDVRCFFVV